VSTDFSRLNLEYLIQARDLVIVNPHRAAVVLGTTDAMTTILADLSPRLLAGIARINHPLLTPHRDVLWWSRLLAALQDGQSAEIDTVLEQASLILNVTEDKVSR
jgi:hypothetical protein